MSDCTPQSTSEASQPQAPQQQAAPPRPKVKSYLHKFYDCGSGGRGAGDGVAERAEADDELRRLLASQRCGKPRRGCHLRPIVWKAMLWIGVNCLIFGALGLAIAFFLPHEPEFVELPGVQGFVRSRSNAEWNRSASVLKYVALGVFGVGAAVTAVGLILPSLVWRLFDEEEAGSAAESAGAAPGRGQRRLQKLLQRPPLTGTSGKTATTRVAASTASGASAEVEEKQVQPVRSAEEGHVTRGQVEVN